MFFYSFKYPKYKKVTHKHAHTYIHTHTHAYAHTDVHEHAHTYIHIRFETSKPTFFLGLCLP